MLLPCIRLRLVACENIRNAGYTGRPIAYLKFRAPLDSVILILHIFIIRCIALGEYYIYPEVPKNGLHAADYNSAESEPIWMQFGTS